MKIVNPPVAAVGPVWLAKTKLAGRGKRLLRKKPGQRSCIPHMLRGGTALPCDSTVYRRPWC